MRLLHSHTWALRTAFALGLAALWTLPAAAQQINLDPPGEREFVLDKALMLDRADNQRIREIGDKLLTDQAIPIIVVTIESMEQYWGAKTRIETFAYLLFNQWGIGVKEVNGQVLNKGMLLLVSRDDRQARIELGDGWGREKDTEAQRIMEEQIIARFKQGAFSDGILKGVEALEKMARGGAMPKKPVSTRSVLLVAGFIALLVFTVVSLIRRGASGWAWLAWGALFSFLGFMLYQFLSSRRRGGSFGGGFTGGSFGGGFSGGGGATGSW